MVNSAKGGDRPRHLFVVGLPRTGTKLAVELINRATDDRACFIPENFFLGRFFRPGVRQRLRLMGDMDDDARVQALVEKMATGAFSGQYWQLLKAEKLPVTREQLLSRLLNSDRSDKAIYDVLLETCLPDEELIFLGDKSGSHVAHVATVLDWYPQAKVIHTFRDPRAVLASQHKKLINKWNRRITDLAQNNSSASATLYRAARPLYSAAIVFYVTFAWCYADYLRRRDLRRYPNNYTVLYFEQLLAQPEENTRLLCDFLDIEFNPAMLTPSQVDSSFDRADAVGFDVEALTRWQGYLKPWMSFWLRIACGRRLRSLGYVQ